MPTDAHAAIPSYEKDFAQFDFMEHGSLDTFDHLGAYRALGPIYTVHFRGEPWVCIGGLEANAMAWRNPDLWDYESALTPFREIMGDRHVTQMDGVPHRQKRRQLKPGFSMSSIGRLIPAIDAVVKRMLGESANKEVSLHDLFMRSLTYANSETVLRAPLSETEVQTFIRFEEEFIVGTIMESSARKAFYERESFVKDKAFVFGYLGQLVQRRLDGEQVEDNFSEVLKLTLEDRGEEVDLQELVSEAYLLLMAGTGNTAKLLNCGLQRVWKDRPWLEALREEVESYQPLSFARGMDAFPKLKATLMEIERMFPAAPVLARVVAQPMEFEGRKLEPGTKVLHMQTLTHFLEEIYEDPYDFKPQRWLENNYPKKAHGTFGGSTHICLGMNLARIHMPIVLANMLKDYAFEATKSPEIQVNFNYGVPQVSDLSGRLVSISRGQ
ncbi:cytochrome P450 [Pelagicoccus sp. SDUM812003]|uniref:cytochrome P450 n=1 Tax=Pelagicoccus sp. SDUM812003 TaxID=3041267 RepID=UPI00280DF7CE|nr:cytochrome P450 [Pelagicoccus sp. SDUM812003]MDQ8205481.1 cytochrome P450 [Pelagicoccus sp. SDUM812003]